MSMLTKKISVSGFLWQKLFCLSCIKSVAIVPQVLPPFSDSKILVIEDEDSQFKILAFLLGQASGVRKNDQPRWKNDHISRAVNGEDAITFFQDSQRTATPYGLICIDNSLKTAMKGFELAVSIRTQGYKGPIIMLTSSTPSELTWNEPNNREKCCLKLTTVKSVDTHWRLTAVGPEHYGPSVTKMGPEAYYLQKPAKLEPLRLILREHFSVNEDPSPPKTPSPPISANIGVGNELPVPLVTPSPQQEIIKRLSQSLEQANSLTARPEEVSHLFELRLADLVCELERSFNPNDPPSTSVHSTDFGSVPEKGSARHIFTSALAQIQVSAANSDESDDSNQWARDCHAIAADALNAIKKYSTTCAFSIGRPSQLRVGD